MPEGKNRSFENKENKSADSAKLSERDRTLINVLDRLAAQIRHQDVMIEELSSGMQELMAAIESSSQKQQSRLDGTEHSIEKYSEGLQRYRSDLLKIVNEQDRVSELTEELSKRQGLITEAQEHMSLILEGLEKRYNTQEKTMTTHYDYSLKQGDALPRQVEDINRHVSKLHMDTEKRLVEDHRDINKMVRDLRSDTMHRLLALDGVEASLKELLIRTEPPEKKKFFVFRFFRFIHLKTSLFFIRIRMRIRARKDPEAKAMIAEEKLQRKLARQAKAENSPAVDAVDTKAAQSADGAEGAADAEIAQEAENAASAESAQEAENAASAESAQEAENAASAESAQHTEGAESGAEGAQGSEDTQSAASADGVQAAQDEETAESSKL